MTITLSGKVISASGTPHKPQITMISESGAYGVVSTINAPDKIEVSELDAYKALVVMADALKEMDKMLSERNSHETNASNKYAFERPIKDILNALTKISAHKEMPDKSIEVLKNAVENYKGY